MSGRPFLDGLTQGGVWLYRTSILVVGLKFALCPNPRPWKVARMAEMSGMTCMRVCARCTRGTPRHKQPCMSRLDLPIVSLIVMLPDG